MNEKQRTAFVAIVCSTGFNVTAVVVGDSLWWIPAIILFGLIACAMLIRAAADV